MSDTVTVILGDDYYYGPEWREANGHDLKTKRPHEYDYGLYEIPAEQVKRWEEAQEAYRKMQDEIKAHMDKRRLEGGSYATVVREINPALLHG